MAHAYPTGLGAFHPHLMDVTSTSNIHHIHQKPVSISLKRKSDTTIPNTIAWNPAVHDRDNSSFPLSDFHECGFSHVEMGSGWVAPSTIVWILGPVGWAEVGGSHCGVTCVAPWRLDTPYLVTLATCIPVAKDGGAQCSCISSVSVSDQVSIATSTSCNIYKFKNIVNYTVN